MSTVKVANIQHPNAASPSIVIDGTGAVQIGGESVATVADQQIAAASINDLSDVSAETAVDGEVLVFSSGSWGSAQVGGGLEGTSYVFVAGDGTAAENGAALAAAYTAAASLTPYGNALSDTNRASVVVAPGIYNTEIIVDTPFVNVVSLDGERSVNITSNFFQYVAVEVTANNVLLRGIDCGANGMFFVGNNLPGLVVEKCRGGNDSFGAFVTASGTFTDCVGGEYSFGGYGTASGVFTNCTADDFSFGTGGTASGTFTNCTGGEYAFAGDSGTASGTFTNCTADDFSFGTGGTASGTFTNCTGGEYAFAGDGGTASGTFIRCIGGQDSFGYNGTLSATVRILYCQITGLFGDFDTPDLGGIIRFSIDGGFAEVNIP